MKGGLSELDRVPPPRVVRAAPRELVARCVLGLTVYTRHPPEAPSVGVARLLRAFLEACPPDRLGLFRTSLLGAWHRVNPSELPELVEGVANEATGATARHLFSFHLADDVGAPGAFFHYREVDDARGAGAGYVQLGLPVEAAPDLLFQLAMEAAHAVPLWCGAAGFLGSAHPAETCTSYSALWQWAKRYVGLDVQDPERARHRAHLGLPSVNWLTLAGAGLFERAGVDPAPMEHRARELGLDWLAAGAAVVVRAGAEPTLGDLNALCFPEAYGHAASLLAPLLPKDPPRWYGRFWRDDQSARWARRFAEPEGWSA